MWWHRMVMPFVAKGAASPQEINQSIVGVLYAAAHQADATGQGRYDSHRDVNIVSLPPWVVRLLIKGVVGRPAGAAGVPLPDRTRDRATRGCSANSRWSC